MLKDISPTTYTDWKSVKQEHYEAKQLLEQCPNLTSALATCAEETALHLGANKEALFSAMVMSTLFLLDTLESDKPPACMVGITP